MAEKCTDIATVEELSLFVIGWKMDHLLNNASMGTLTLKKVNAVYSTWFARLKKKNVQCRKRVVMGLDGAATFVGKKS